MKTMMHILLVFFFWLPYCMQPLMSQQTGIAPGRPEDFKPFIYKHTTEELKKFTKKHIQMAEKAVEEMDEVIFNGPYKASFGSLTTHPTPEWYMDAKFGIMFNYGIYSVAGYGNKGYGGNYYTDCFLDAIYNRENARNYLNQHWGEDVERDDFIPMFTASDLDADEYIELFKDAGAKFFVQFNMHRSTGMPLWNSEYTFRDPVDMPPHRDLANEFVQACRKHEMPYGFYLNLEDTAYPILDGDGKINIREWTMFNENPWPVEGSFEVMHPYDPEVESRRLQGKIPVYNYVTDYLLPISKEFIDKYEPDYLWFDGGWKRPAWYYNSEKIVSYYYNKFEGKKDVMVNCRIGNDLYGTLGDVVISEGGQMDAGEQSAYWEECTPIGKNFAYDWREHDGNVPSSTELIHMLIRIVAKGGNLLLIVAPDGNGKIPEYQIERLQAMGAWLKENGESIYDTRTSPLFCEESNFGRNVYYTQGKDLQYTYAICLQLTGKELILSKVKARKNTEIKMLGHNAPLSWTNLPWGLTIRLPEEVKEANSTSGKPGWVFRIEAETFVDEGHIQNK